VFDRFINCLQIRNVVGSVGVHLRIVVSINTDVLALVAEDLRISVAGGGSDGGSHEESEYDELLDRNKECELYYKGGSYSAFKM
jgi:hypothetical protein